jgi:hypothetical protein
VVAEVEQSTEVIAQVTMTDGVTAAAAVVVQDVVSVAATLPSSNGNASPAAGIAAQGHVSGGGGDGEDLEALTALLMGDGSTIEQQQQQQQQQSQPVTLHGAAGLIEGQGLATPPPPATSQAGISAFEAQPPGHAAGVEEVKGGQHRPWWPAAPEQSVLELPSVRVQPLEPAGTQGQGAFRPSLPLGSYPITLERLLDDLVLLTFITGNDFLPLLPSLDIYDRPSSLDLIFTAYKGLLPQLGSGITQAGGGHAHCTCTVLMFSKLIVTHSMGQCTALLCTCTVHVLLKL